MPDQEHRSTVLMVGQGEPMQTALGEALRRHGISVAASATAELEQAVRVYAPDMVVLIGDAAIRGGESVVRRMAENRATDVLPVAVVSNDAVLKDEARDFRSGAVAIVPRGAGADSIARRLVELSEEIPRRPGVVSGALSESNLQELLDLVSDETRTGILSIRSPKGVIEGMPVVVETVRPAPDRKQQILDLLTEAIADNESLEYEFHETTGGRLSLLPSASAPDEVDLTQLFGARVVVLDSDQLRAERLANLLVSRGVQIAAADFSTAVLPRIREVDPQVVVLDSSAVGGEGVDFVRAMRKDPQLRWASMLVVRWEDFWPDSTSDSSPDLAQLASRLLPLIDQDAEHARRAEDEVDFDTRLELTGPGRLLRALGSVPGVRRLSINGQQRSIQVDVADNSILAAYATLQEGTKQTLQGMPALLALWGLNSGRVSVREQDLPSVANIMMPVDEALGLVSHQLGFAGGGEGVEVDAATIPPEKPDAEELATDPPTASPVQQLDDARTMAPARFGHLRNAVGAPPTPDFPRAEFREEEVPTNKVAQMLGRMETRRIPANRGVQETNENAAHVDHAQSKNRKPKGTELGLAPAFEMLPNDGLDDQKTVPSPRKPTPPPPPIESRKPIEAPSPKTSSLFEPELARALEGATIVAPAAAATSRGMPAWIQALLLIALIVGVAVLGLQLWSRSAVSTEEPEVAEAEGNKGPITGPLNEGEPAEKPSGEAEGETKVEAAAMAFDETEMEELAEAAVAEAEPEAEPEPAAEPARKPEPKRVAPKPVAKKPAATEPTTPSPVAPGIPTQNLPRDPARASDVLVHRSLPLIRSGDLALAEATLDRAWELDPKNPQAMAGYARLFIAKNDGPRAAKWAKKAVRKRGRRAEYHVLYGDALRLEGDIDAARKSWRKALSVDPDNRSAKARLAATSARVAN